MTGWQYRLFDYNPATDGDEEAWARARADDGWQMWTSAGAWTTIEDQRVRRWSLRRPTDRPYRTGS